MKLAAAIGRRTGDYIKLANQWAEVVITHSPDDDQVGEYKVSGDTIPEVGKQTHFTDVAAAFTYALACLAEFERGAAR